MGNSKEELEARLYALQALMESPGWAYFTQVAQQAAFISKETGRKAETSHQMGFHFGAALTAEQLLTWPQREMGSLKATLQQM
jgi:hypothetical protein